MAYTKEETAAAYETVNATEKQMILDIEAALTAFTGTLNAAIADLPVSGASTPARTFVTQLLSQVNMASSYQLTTLKQQYGITVAPTTNTNTPV